MERIGNTRSGHAASADPDIDHHTDDNYDGGDGDGDNDADDYRGQDSAIKVSCRICGYQWQPKRKSEEIRQCPRRNSRKWKGNDPA